MELLTISRAYFLIIRPKNLFIVAVSQWILYYFIIVPLLSTPALNSHLFSLLVLDTVLIAAGGYIINDILDFKADMTNKPSKTYIPYPIALTKANIYYMFILVSGFSGIVHCIKNRQSPFGINIPYCVWSLVSLFKQMERICVNRKYHRKLICGIGARNLIFCRKEYCDV
ncbi:MAG: hypothetical protein IPP49_05345 [Saprospiraceae bacterium]|nr:hypothetical protein [Saprospiraceae bacterium]